MPSSKRDQLVDTALQLFCRHGFNATGIDTILAEAQVAKMTLYNHFRSKEELILAALRRRDELFRNWFMKQVEQQTDDPRRRLTALFDVLEQWLTNEDFNGCMFINAAAEFPDLQCPIHATVAEHKHLMRGYVRHLAEVAGAADPPRLAAELTLLMEGAIVWAQATGDQDAVDPARRAAARLIAEQVTAPATVE